jgi:membrane-bound lytic murein transglycosylase D
VSGTVEAPGSKEAAAPGEPVAASDASASDRDQPADGPDEPTIEQEVQSESRELEDVRKAEEHAQLMEPGGPQDATARAGARLGLESQLRLRLRDAARDLGPVAAEAQGRIAGLPEIDHDLLRLQAEYDIPVEVNDAVVAYVRFFQSSGARPHFVKWLGRSFRYSAAFRRILREEGLPEDTIFLAMIESGFANHATSRARAVGPWQFIAPTGKRMGLAIDFWVDERRDPEKSARAAARYLKELQGQTGDWRLAWAGYNAGVGKIFKARKRGQLDFWSMARGRVLRRETKGYVPKLMAAAIITKHPEAFGFTPEEVTRERWTEYERVDIPRSVPLSAVARAAEVPERALLDLNPELRRTCTPPRGYALKVPKGQAEVFARNWERVSEETPALAFATHRLRHGESLAAVAKSYGVAPATILQVNGLHPARRVRPGTDLVIPLNALARQQGTTTAALVEPERVRGHRRAPEHRAATPEPVALAGRLRATVLVRAGDSLWAIAQRFGVAVSELCRWNGIGNAARYRLVPGRALVVYTRAARPSA